MLVYHGTTQGRAARIRREGFLPRKPSQRVWFAQSIAYARGRAKCQARRANDRAVVLSCEIDLPRFRATLGPKRIIVRGGNIAIDAPVAVDVLRSTPSVPGEPAAPGELAAWVNVQLGLKDYKGVRPRTPGILRLSKWVVNRVSERKGKYPRPRELFEMARRFLPEWFKGCAFDPERARVQRIVNIGEVTTVAVPPEEKMNAVEERALASLEAANPKRRIRGLETLRDLEDEDLFEWCMMFLEDPAPSVRAASARIMRDCRFIAPEILIPLTDSDDKILRGAAVATLAKHLGTEEPGWFELGLKDPEAHVRLMTAQQLHALNPSKHLGIFELALYDPNPKVSEQARKLSAGTGLGMRY